VRNHGIILPRNSPCIIYSCIIFLSFAYILVNISAIFLRWKYAKVFLFFYDRYVLLYSLLIIPDILEAMSYSSLTQRYLRPANHEKCRGVHSNTNPTDATTRDDFLRDEIPLNPLLSRATFISRLFLLALTLSRSCIFYERARYPFERGNNACPMKN